MKMIDTDKDLAFGLFILGLSQTEIANQLKCSQATVARWKRVEKWEEKQEIVLTERLKRGGKEASVEQEFIRRQECAYARRLLGLAEQILRQINVDNATLLDLTRLLELASRLGRLGSGLPLSQVDVIQTYDLGENLMAAIDRAYSHGKSILDVPKSQ